MLQIKFR